MFTFRAKISVRFKNKQSNKVYGQWHWFEQKSFSVVATDCKKFDQSDFFGDHSGLGDIWFLKQRRFKGVAMPQIFFKKVMVVQERGDFEVSYFHFPRCARYAPCGQNRWNFVKTSKVNKITIMWYFQNIKSSTKVKYLKPENPLPKLGSVRGAQSIFSLRFCNFEFI